MNEDTIRLLEEFITSDNKSEVLDRMPSLHWIHKYFSARAELYSEDRSKFDSLLESLSGQDRSKASMLKLRKLMLDLESSPSEVIKEVTSSYISRPFFDYSAPEMARSEDEVTYPSELDSSIFQVDLTEAHKTLSAYKNLSERETAKLEVSQMSNEIFMKFLNSSYLPSALGVPERIVQLIKDNKFKESDTFNRLGLNQLTELEAIYPDIIGYKKFVHAKINKQYLAGTESYSERELFQVFQILWSDIQGYPDSLNYLKLSVLNALLTLGLQFGRQNADYFEEFIKLRLVEIDRKNTQSQIRLLSQFPELSLEELFKIYIPEIIKSIEDVKKYSRLIDTSRLLKEFAKNQILRGEPLEEYKEHLSQSEIEHLGNSVELEPCKENQKVYSRNEEVSIKMRLKNVRKVLVRLLEINTKAYYAKNTSKIKTDINLDGLVAKEEQVYEYSESPFLRVVRTFDFPSLAGKCGLFAVEFIGNGRYSRALIQKGTLKYVSKVTIAGHMLAVLDENNKVCKDESAGITVDGRFYSTAEGHAIIPFAPNYGLKNLVLTDGHIAELVPGFEHLSEEYQLKTAFLIHPEQFLMGNRATLNMKPVLFMNGIKAHESLLTDLSVTVTVTDIDGIPTSKTFKRLSLPKDTGLLPVEIEVPPRLSNIEISLSGKVKYASTQKTSTLSSFYQQIINENLTDTKIFTPQLRAQADGYYVEVRGRNGEPLKNVPAEFAFQHSSLQSIVRSSTLSTDANGLIKLGHLPGVKTFTGNFNQSGQETQSAWSIDKFENQSSYPSNIYLCEGDEFGIPIELPATSTFHPYNLTFNFYRSDALIGPAYDKLDYENSMLSMKNLEKGTYTLTVPDKATITIEVVDGHHWGTEHIVTEDMAISTPQQYKSIAITDTTTENSELVVKVIGDIENTVVHALHTTYHSPEFSQTFNDFADMFRAQYSQTHFERPISFYLDSIYLDEEYRYVLDRRNLPRFMGSTLPKPQILLKRLMVSETETATQQARTGGNLASMSRKKAEGKGKLMMKKMAKDSGMDDTKLTENLDFLDQAAIDTVSVQVDENGLARIPLSSNHSEILLIATNKESCCSKIAVTEGTLKLRELRLSESMDNSLSYAEQKKCEGLQVDNSFVVKDVASTKFEIIDSLSKLYTAQVAVSNVNGSHVEYGKWNFLGEWGLLNMEKKLELFESFSSHELHLFLYKKDKEFFDTIVRPYLACKMEKDLIDKFLLEEDIEEYTKITLFSPLNYLEKCLVIQRMRETGSDFAMNFAERATKLIAEEAVLCKTNEALRSRQYDSILGSRSMDEADDFCEEESEGDARMVATSMKHQTNSMKKSKNKRGYKQKAEKERRRASSDEFEEMEECRAMAMDMDYCFGAVGMEEEDLLGARMEQPVYYEKLGATKEFVETYYYNRRPEDKVTIGPSKFWAELAAAPYVLSDSFMDQTSSLPELVSALAFSSLEFQPNRHGYSTSGTSATIKASSPALIFYKELSEVSSDNNTEILVAQRYIDPADMYIYDELGEREKTVTQFLKNHVYMCQVIVTNTSAVHMKLRLLVEVPQGSIPLVPYKYSDTLLLEVPSFHTLKQSYEFYFPQSGTFTHFPPNVSFRGTVISKAHPNTITVQDRLEVTEFTSFTDLVIGNKKEMILDFLKNENLFSPEKQFDWSLILHLMRDLDFWRSVLDILRGKNYFQKQIWEFSIYHEEPQTFAEYLSSTPNFSEKLGYFFSSKYIETGKLGYRHREFDPLVNARAYRLADKERITNKRFLQIYQDFLLFLAEKSVLENEDYICWAQYMILQDRLEEAAGYYSKIQMDYSTENCASGKLQLQYDYLSCYLDLEKAKIIAPLYKDYPIETWKNYFKEVLELIAELSEEFHIPTKVKEKEPALDFEVESGVISLHYSFVDRCKIRLYLIDLEVLFSKKPFFIEGTQDFSFVTANIEMDVDLDAAGKHQVEIPEELENKNFVVEVDYKTYVVSKPYFANSLKINVIERYGVIKVMDTKLAPRSRTYIKAFAKKKNGNIEFYKDGYTDIRGKFDFVSLNVDMLSQIEEFALLVVDDDLGSQVTTAKPPPQ